VLPQDVRDNRVSIRQWVKQCGNLVTEGDQGKETARRST
jgi:hypothetical protein